jgi:putative peptide zinc metalloprotease protein
MPKSLALLVALIAALALAAAKPTAAHAQDNAAVAVNLKDGASIFRFAFKIARVNQEVVDNTNAAVAFASCEECQTIAVAFQVVLIFSDPDVVTTTNLALALNYECTACQTLASAYQFVLTTGGPVRFTPEGHKRIAELRRAIRDLLRSDASITEIQAELDVLADELREVIRTELVAAGNSGERGTDEEAAAEEEPVASDEEPAETETTETTETAETTTETTETSP